MLTWPDTIQKIILLASLNLSQSGYGVTEFSGQANLFGTYTQDSHHQGDGLFSLLPDMKYTRVIGSWAFEAQATGNIWGSVVAIENQTSETKQGIETHRLWFKASNESTEYRIGLQKISFGPAKILRTLQWFDQLDPKDPTKFTKGVKAFLVRKYFSDNSNLWIWALNGNKDYIGPLPMIAAEDTPELGARYQFPVSSTEFALSVHQRTLDNEELPSFSGSDRIVESRLAIDGVWDLVAGMWFEASVTEFIGHDILPDQVLMGTIGADYTFDVGNGLYSSLELFGINSKYEAKDSPIDEYLFAINHSYAIGIIEQVRVFWIGCFQCHDTNVSIDFQRTYDSWLMNIGGFYQKSESKLQAIGSISDLGNINGKGIRLTLQINI